MSSESLRCGRDGGRRRDAQISGIAHGLLCSLTATSAYCPQLAMKFEAHELSNWHEYSTVQVTVTQAHRFQQMNTLQQYNAISGSSLARKDAL